MLFKAYAKINLTLDILGTREDGFHEVAMIMQSIGLHDDLDIEKKDAGIELAIDNTELPADESNLCYKAAELMFDEFNVKGGVKIDLTKRIPMGAGLGGGSADAAAVIRGMNEIFSLNASPEKLADISAKIGSDIPFCVTGGTQFATGRGEILKRLPDFPKTYLTLIKPAFSVSTPHAYKMYDNTPVVRRPDNEGIIAALKNGDVKNIYSMMGNVLEAPIAKEYPEINEYKEMMIKAGAIFAQMTGSGSVVFAIAEDMRSANKIADAMKAKTSYEVFVTETISNIEQ
ncbi:MAG: 4-(cytidine 5'-diphospho)-2-C-methyl-D-erythritol kinase [Selenomonadaceae bacterium]|nr:4-(cytidine 5'-diphospho)-2-C-methyl-D-erythritol kinase [Selenomonadaceae bacterium]